MTDDKAYDITHNPDSLADLLLKAGEQLKQKDIIIQTMHPKAVFADAVAVSDDGILVGALAKLLKQNGVDTGQKRLFEWLRANGYLIKDGRDKNIPTQRAMEMNAHLSQPILNNSRSEGTQKVRSSKIRR